MLILIVLALSAFLYFEAQSYLNKNLSEFIAKKSKGKYELSFDNLELNFRHWGLEMNQVSFHPSDSVTNLTGTLSANKQYYSFASPNIRFGGIRLLQLLFKGKLEIAEILISQPELKIHGKKSGAEDQTDNIATVLQELRPLVTRGFKSVKIGKIELSNASFDFYNLLGDTKKLAKAENITIGILNFYTDSVLLPDADKLFDAEDIYLRMQNYQNKLGDSIHSLNAGLVTYSLKRSFIEAQNVELKPVAERYSSKGRYFISVPQIKLTSKYIHEFYKGNEIPIDSMILTDAEINYWPGNKKLKSGNGTIDELDLYELIKEEFSSVSIRDFKLRNAHLMLYKAPEDKVNQQELKNINLGLHDFLLDSVSLKDTSRIFYAKKINFSASEYELTLGDNIHRMRAGYLHLSTIEKSILVKNIQLYPVQGGSSITRRQNTIEAGCDSIRFDFLNFKKAFHEKRFAFQAINLFNPEVKITRNRVAEEKTAPENTSFIYQLISNYIKGIYADQVSVQEGKVQLINKTGVLKTGNIQSAVKLQLSGFALDEISARKTDRLFFANQIELAFNNYQMQLVDQLHKLTIRNLTISTRNKQARFQNLHLSPVSGENMESLLKQYSRSELYEFTIPELSLTNADFHEAFFNKKLSVDTLSIQAPQIYYENFALLKQAKPKVEFEDFFHLLSDYLDNLHIGVVHIPDGTIRLISHNRKGKTISLDNHFSLRMEN
ncbi:MAG: hypothetical protein JNL03_09305, partial [Prolixibacteraceae bacterium]|nr:hypothetical protein [Prolixibacteraceae bacterium]